MSGKCWLRLQRPILATGLPGVQQTIGAPNLTKTRWGITPLRSAGSCGIRKMDLINRPFSSTPQPRNTAPRIHFVKDEAYLTVDINSSRTTFRVYEDRPVSNLFAALQEEDPSIKSIVVRDGTGVGSARWARSTIGSDILEVAMKKGEIAIELDGKPLTVQIQPLHERLEPLKHDILQLETELKPLEDRKFELDAAAEQRASLVSWLGLFWLCAQLGVMDVMEPISYVLSAATGIMAYWFFVLTRKEYTYEVLHEITVTSAQRDLYSRKQFDFARYSELKEKIRELNLKVEELHELQSSTRQQCPLSAIEDADSYTVNILLSKPKFDVPSNQFSIPNFSSDLKREDLFVPWPATFQTSSWFWHLLKVVFAQFVRSGGSIYVALDNPATVIDYQAYQKPKTVTPRDTDDPFPCSWIFDTNTIGGNVVSGQLARDGFDSDCTVTMLSSSELLFDLSAEFTSLDKDAVAPLRRMYIRAGALWYEDAAFSETGASFITVQAPDVIEVPNVDINAPLYVSSCSDLILDLSDTTGDLGRLFSSGSISFSTPAAVPSATQ
ncbi:hypothetical protein HDU97_005539 [Phlyctochytrium planicorne]|nr:hypothetical protein HDU97_005539 [Phlyctochytrium planicorne]